MQVINSIFSLYRRNDNVTLPFQNEKFSLFTELIPWVQLSMGACAVNIKVSFGRIILPNTSSFLLLALLFVNGSKWNTKTNLCQLLDVWYCSIYNKIFLAMFSLLILTIWITMKIVVLILFGFSINDMILNLSLIIMLNSWSHV